MKIGLIVSTLVIVRGVLFPLFFLYRLSFDFAGCSIKPSE